jgi:hypothetical protein
MRIVPLSLLSQRMAMMVVWSTAVRYRFRDTRFSIEVVINNSYGIRPA